jgi:hypothetical protein
MLPVANIGIPMICVYWPSAWIALVPVVAIEAWVGVHLLQRPISTCVKAAFLSNLVSTLIGIPITWLVLALVESAFFGGGFGLETFPARLFSVTLQAPWLVPYQDDLYWMIPAAALVLSFPFYLMSVLTEAPVARWCLPDVPRRAVFRWASWANVASYSFLLCIIVALGGGIRSMDWVFVMLAPLTDFVLEVFWRCQRWLAVDSVSA